MSQEEEKTEEVEVAVGEQIPLIDVAPENAKEIIQHAKIYRAAVKKRLKALEVETEEKQKLLELIGNQHLQRTEDGKIKFRCDGYIITVTPRDELIRIKEEKEKDSE